MNTEQNYVGRGNYANTPPPMAQNAAKTSFTADNRQHQVYVNPATGEIDEIWKPFPLFDLERFYEVSNEGQIRSLLTGSIVKTFSSRDGEFFNLYHPVTFKYICVQVHRAVAFAFVPNPDGLKWVKRKNGNKRHNHAANLEWVPSPGQIKRVANGALLEAGQPFSDFILNQLQQEGKLTGSERERTGIVPAQDDSMAPQISEGTKFVAVPVNPVDYASLIGKVVAVVVKAKLFAYYLGRVVSIDEDFVRVSRDNSEWSERIESWSVIASIARVVSVLETSIN